MSSRPDAPKKRHVAVASTSRPDTPELEGGTPLPEEITGRATGTNEDVTALFASNDPAHLADGFRGSSDDDRGSDISKDEDTGSDDPEDHLQPGIRG